MKNENEDKSIDTKEYNRRLMNNIVRMPFIVKSAVDSAIYTDKGVFYDWWGDEGVCSLGYNSDVFKDAVQDFFQSGQPHQLPDIYPNEKRFEAAEIICDRTGMDKIFFANSGTEANEAAIKIARKYWYDKGEDKNLILTLEGNFHGRTGLSLAASDFRVSPYHRHGFGPIAKGFGVIDGNFNLVCLDGVEDEPIDIFDGPFQCEKVAAIIMAPVLGNNLVKTYPRKFWEMLKLIKEETGVLLIFDDVQAGSGRAGYYATWQHPDIVVKPDIMTLAKGMAMGFPMSCMLADKKIAKSFTPGVHFNTFGGSPFVCHMATKLYQWLDDNLSSIRERGEIIREFFNDAKWIKEHDGSGLLNAFTPDYENLRYDGFDFIHAARLHGISLVTHRRFGPIRFTPPLNIKTDELAASCATLHIINSALVKEG